MLKTAEQLSNLEEGQERENRIKEKLQIGSSEKMAEKQVEQEMAKEKEGIQTFEEFDEIFTHLKPQLLSATEDLKNLPELEAFRKRKDDIPASLEGKSSFEVEANLCKRLINAYERGDKEELQKIPTDSGSAEDFVEKMMKKGRVRADISKEEFLEDMRKSMIANNTLTGGAYGLSRMSPFGNETTGYHVNRLSSKFGILAEVLMKIKDPAIAKDMDSLMEFIRKKQGALKREITLSRRYQEAIEHSTGTDDKNLRLLYQEMEIENKEEVIAIGKRLEQLFRLAYEFEQKLRE